MLSLSPILPALVNAILRGYLQYSFFLMAQWQTMAFKERSNAKKETFAKVIPNSNFGIHSEFNFLKQPEGIGKYLYTIRVGLVY